MRAGGWDIILSVLFEMDVPLQDNLKMTFLKTFCSSLVLMHLVGLNAEATSIAIIDPCSTFKCRNGGVCTAPADAPSCQCPEGFSGPRCETCNIISRDPCVCFRCENGGNCTAPADLPSCKCPTGFTGKRCETPTTKDRCKTYRCENGGACSIVGGKPKCLCPQGFRGRRCQKEGDVCKRFKCKNNGRCKEQNFAPVCICPQGYYGRRCQRDLCGRCPKNQACVYTGIICITSPCLTYKCQPKVQPRKEENEDEG